MIIFRLFFLAAFWVLLVPAQARAAAPVPLDRILVIVNGGAITRSALDTRVRQVEQQLAVQHIHPPSASVLRKQVLSRMVVERLQRQYARRTGIKITKTEVDHAFDTLAARNQMTTAAFTAALARDGIDVEGFRRQLRTQLIIRQIVARVIRPRVQVTDREVARYLRRARAAGQQRYHVKDIFVPISGTNPQSVHKAQALAQSLETKLHSGHAFSELAIAYSQGAEALQGGDLGWKKASQLPSSFLAVL
ncbi:MAG TPA: SurA N-terminal domain-containing protein, partial [Acidiferrobacteraceae bacterium]|nr:SurA N-terminal domain-containing protein [Acidiferrobacteraceae bacterium]